MSKIEWTDETWNPIIGCSKKSAECDHCYAEPMAVRLANIPATKENYSKVVSNGKWNGKTAFVESALLKPFKWKKHRKIFVGSMTDIFHETVPFEWLDRVFAVMAMCQRHTFQILTKRPERMREYLARGHSLGLGVNAHLPSCINFEWPLPNVWTGVTAGTQAMADERIPVLLNTPSALRFVSVEPVLEAVDLKHVRTPSGITMETLEGDHSEGDVMLDWVICGGESGSGARPMHPDWVRSLRDQCKEAGVPFMFKQWGEWAECQQTINCKRTDKDCDLGKQVELDGHVFVCPAGKKNTGRILDGQAHNEFPEVK